ncbi:MAG: DUF6290 family protein [Pseudomonadota bacterium]
MSVLTFRIPADLEKVLEKFCEEEDRTKSWLIKKALQEKLEDWQDYRSGIKALKEHKKSGSKTYSLEEIAKELGIRLE